MYVLLSEVRVSHVDGSMFSLRVASVRISVGFVSGKSESKLCDNKSTCGEFKWRKKFAHSFRDIFKEKI